jgi:hypothetical protein
MILFTQVNKNKALLAAVQLAKTFKENKLSVALVTEPYAHFNKPISLPVGTKAIFHNENPRAAIIHSKEINLTKVQHLTCRDMAAGVLRVGERSIMCLSIYMDINKAVRQNIFVDAMKYALDKRF